MNDLPMIRNLCYAQGILGSPGGANISSAVWRKVVSSSKAAILGEEKRIFAVIFVRSGADQCWYVEIVSFCVIGAIKSTDKHSCVRLIVKAIESTSNGLEIVRR